MNLYNSAFSQHDRHFEGSELVYPVLSRRSGGISLGVNLSPGKLCNFNCLYCQVERTSPPAVASIDLDVLERELDYYARWIDSGEIYQHSQFSQVPPELRRFNDIAFSGDGEPTASSQFGEACELAVAVKTRLGLDQVKIVVITNATLLHQEPVVDALTLLDANQGEVWAKLDAGTEDYYRRVNQAYAPYTWVVENLLATARKRPIVIQTLFFNINGVGPTDEEILAYTGRLNGITLHGGRIKAVHLLTIARDPHNLELTALSDKELDRIAALVKNETQLPVEKFYGRPI